MKFSDGHIHIMRWKGDRARFADSLEEASIYQGLLISLPPSSYGVGPGGDLSFQSRLDNLLFWIEARTGLFPFFWIDPLEKKALRQVEDSVSAGIKGFKIICDRFYPSDPSAMEVYRAICKTGLPLLFHSGILWDNRPGSSIFNRPICFEELLGIEGFVFALAHISWPWCDEMIALYGKFNSLRKKLSKLFVDITPGTPPLYREEVLTKLLMTGYPIGKNIFFGTDQCVDTYNVSRVLTQVEQDRKIYQTLKISPDDVESIMLGNLQRFLGVTMIG